MPDVEEIGGIKIGILQNHAVISKGLNPFASISHLQAGLRGRGRHGGEHKRKKETEVADR